MKRTRKSAGPISADAIAGLADRGKDVTRYFKGEGTMVQPIQRVNVDLTPAMVEELDRAAQELNVSRQAVIKTLVRQALDRHYLAQRARRAGLSAIRSAGSLGTHGRATWSRDDLHER
jgi:predicted transcriptional regulator